MRNNWWDVELIAICNFLVALGFSLCFSNLLDPLCWLFLLKLDFWSWIRILNVIYAFVCLDLTWLFNLTISCLLCQFLLFLCFSFFLLLCLFIFWMTVLLHYVSRGILCFPMGNGIQFGGRFVLIYWVLSCIITIHSSGWVLFFCGFGFLFFHFFSLNEFFFHWKENL